jgi:hypothetical protein
LPPLKLCAALAGCYFALANPCFAMQRQGMETNWAAEQLQTIRTLMERSAVYRRALAPIMIFAGSLGVVGGVLGWLLNVNSARGFVLFWLGLAVFALVGSFLLVRRQALKDSEAFWSPPTKRIAAALLPPFAIGAFISSMALCRFDRDDLISAELTMLIVSWVWLYGCAIHSAGFFMPGRSRLFAWPFFVAGGVLFCRLWNPELFPNVSPHLLMASVFGGFHLAFGIYLDFTEQRKQAA